MSEERYFRGHHQSIWENQDQLTSLLLLLSHFSHVRLCNPMDGSPSGSESLGFSRKQKLKSSLPGDISITSDTQMTPPLRQKWRRTKETLDESEKGDRKSWLNSQHSKKTMIRNFSQGKKAISYWHLTLS